jgi:hypothetical protein
MVRYLTDFDAIKKVSDKEILAVKYAKAVIAQAKEYDGFIVVGAGRYFKNMIDIQTVLGEKIIHAVCDNIKTIQGCEKYGYHILSVEAGVRQYKFRKWLILNKYHADEIERQLIALGIDEVNIVKLDSLPDVITMVDNF